MGSNASLEKPILPNIQNKTESYKVISKKDVQIIRQSWRELNEVGDFKTHGLNMMIKIFTKNKDIRHIWKFAAHLNTEEEMRNSQQLKSHGNKIFEAINAAVNSLDKIEVLNSMLYALGQRHKDYGTKVDHFPIILEAYLLVLQEALGTKYTKEVDSSWKRTFSYFQSQMCKGMES